MDTYVYGSDMDEEELIEYLREAGVGTLAFGDQRGGYAVPMSFGYDEVNERCVFQIAFGENNEKRRYIEEGKEATLCVYDRDSIDEWRSVLVRGVLEKIQAEELTQASAVFAAQAKIVSPDVFQKPLEDIKLEWYGLEVDEVTGRKNR